MSGFVAGCLGHFTRANPQSEIRNPQFLLDSRDDRVSSEIPPQTVHRSHRPGPRRRRTPRSGGAGPGRTRLPLCRPRGVGKTTAARILAMALNCERRTPAAAGEPCGRMRSVPAHLDGRGQSGRGRARRGLQPRVDDARDLRERGDVRREHESGSSHIVRRGAYAHRERECAAENPRGATARASSSSSPPPSRRRSPTPPRRSCSRLQRFDFRPHRPHAIVARLKEVAQAEKLSVDADALHLIAKSANGGMRDALSLLDQCSRSE